jgi:diguanylate cyclase (GGDEF)-like protein
VRLGRDEDNTVRVNDKSVSRHHAFLWVDEQGRPWLTDLGSTNGTHLNNTPCLQRAAVRLRPGDQVRFGQEMTVKFAELGPNEVEFHRAIYERSIRDSLTGLHNRAYFLDQLPTLISQGPAVGKSPAVLMIDLDHFKRVNDTFGHSAGDAVLRTAAVVLLDSTRHDDLVGRFGGEEFVVALPVPAIEQAMLVAERIRQSLAARETTHDGQALRVTASIGVAYAPPAEPRSAPVLVEEADRRMYQAKAAGRNRVVCQCSDDRGPVGP